MSQDLQSVKNILQGILNPDNNIRKEAEKNLSQLRSNNSALCYYLSQILVECPEKGVKTLASVLLRKILDIPADEKLSSPWKDFDDKCREQIKENLLKSIISESDKAQKIKYCDTMAVVAENVFEYKGTWSSLLDFIYQGISLELLPENISNIETVLFLMSQIFGILYEEMVSKLDAFIATFDKFFKFNDFNLKTRTSQVIGEILSIVKKKDSKKFKVFIPSIIEHTYLCLSTPNQESNLRICLMSISDLATAEPNILRKSFGDLFILLGKVAEQKDLTEQNLRELSFEIIVSLVEAFPKLFKSDTPKLEAFIQMIFKYALEMDTDITDEWITPKTLSFLEEDVVPEGQVQLCLGMIERVCQTMEKEKVNKVLEILVVIVQDLLGKSSDNWKYKYIAFMTITSMCEEIDDISDLKNILPICFENLTNENCKIRFACLQVVEVCCDQFNPTFQKNYHKEIVPTLLKLMQDNVLRNQLQCTETLIGFLENSPEEIAKEHTKEILDVLFPILLNDSTFVSLKENILNVLSELVEVSDTEFDQYSSKCLEILIKVLTFCLTQGKEKTIYGSLLELVTKIGPKCEGEYKKYIPDIISAMITLQNNIPYSTDPIFEHLNSAWEKLIPYIKSDFKNLTAPVIECSLRLVANVPTMSVSNAPNTEFDIQALLKDDTQCDEIVKQKIQVNTFETSDYAASILLLTTVIEAFGDEFLPYLEHTEKTILSLLSFEANLDIRMEAANTIPYLLTIVKNQNKTELLHQKAITYLTNLILALEKEDSNPCISCQLDAIGSLIEKVGLFLQNNQIKDVFVKLLQVFDNVEKTRISLLSNIEETKVEMENDKKLGNHQINSDDEDDGQYEEALDDLDNDVEEIEDVLVSIADVMGSLFKTHKELTLEVVDLLIKNLLPKYFTTTSSNFEIKMGLYIVDDMIEFLGQSLLSGIWKDLAGLVLRYCDDKEAFLRQAAIYGVGEFAINTTNDYASFAPAMLDGVDKALRYNSDGQNPNQWSSARDNAVSALGKIIKYQYSCVNGPELIKKWVGALPLTDDNFEAEKVHKIFVEMLINNVDLVIGQDKENLPKVIRILCKISDTKFVDEKTNEEVKKLISGIKTNTQFSSFIDVAIKEANKELQEKMNELLKN